MLPEEFSIEYKSVMVSGLLEEIEDREEKVRCAQVVGDKYSTISSEEYANRAADKIRVFRLNIEHISGKRLVKAGEPGMGYKKGVARIQRTRKRLAFSSFFFRGDLGQAVSLCF